MSAETETELLGLLKHNLRLAAENCESLASAPRYGKIYTEMRKQLKAIENACTQIAVHRNGDARWLPIGQMMEEAHQRAGAWLRQGQPLAARQSRTPLFRKLAENLRALYRQCEELETKATGRMGMILPKPLPLHREHRPVQVRKSTGGVILPDSYAG